MTGGASTSSVGFASQQSLKFVYSTDAVTRRGSDFDTLNVMWQPVMFRARRETSA